MRQRGGPDPPGCLKKQVRRLGAGNPICCYPETTGWLGSLDSNREMSLKNILESSHRFPRIQPNSGQRDYFPFELQNPVTFAPRVSPAAHPLFRGR